MWDVLSNSLQRPKTGFFAKIFGKSKEPLNSKLENYEGWSFCFGVRNLENFGKKKFKSGSSRKILHMIYLLMLAFLDILRTGSWWSIQISRPIIFTFRGFLKLSIAQTLTYLSHTREDWRSSECSIHLRFVLQIQTCPKQASKQSWLALIAQWEIQSLYEKKSKSFLFTDRLYISNMCPCDKNPLSYGG